VRDDLLAHKQALYTKDNLVIVVAGAIDDERAMLDLISSSFGDLPNHRSISAPVFEGVTSKENDHYAKNTEQNHLIISLPGVSGDHPDKYALQTLTTALGGTMSSRLFQRIREQE
jgi:predicted Zn-dependent peptidase